MHDLRSQSTIANKNKVIKISKKNACKVKRSGNIIKATKLGMAFNIKLDLNNWLN